MDSSSFSGAFDGMITLFIVTLCLFPLGVWKLIEIIIWMFGHIRVVIQ